MTPTTNAAVKLLLQGYAAACRDAGKADMARKAEDAAVQCEPDERRVLVGLASYWLRTGSL